MMRCLETRRTPIALKRRRYVLEDGRHLTTYELPATVVDSIGAERIRKLMRAWERGEERRKRAHQVREFVANHPDWKSTALAHHLGVTDQRIRQLRKELMTAREE